MEGPIIQIENGSDCRLMRDYRVTLENDAVLTLRRGFSFNGASIPRCFWRVVGHPFEMPLLIAATAHDGLYSAELFPRAQCDWNFLLLMQRSGICWIKRNTVYAAVRSAGWAVWNKHTPASVAAARKLCLIEVIA